MPLTQELQALLKDRNWQEADKLADELLALITGKEPAEAKTEASTVQDRLPSKIQKIQKALPAWVEKTGNKEKATALMRKLQEQLNDRDFEEAEKTADSLLKMMGA
jgi:hypothetical protein